MTFEKDAVRTTFERNRGAYKTRNELGKVKFTGTHSMTDHPSNPYVVREFFVNREDEDHPMLNIRTQYKCESGKLKTEIEEIEMVDEYEPFKSAGVALEYFCRGHHEGHTTESVQKVIDLWVHEHQ